MRRMFGAASDVRVVMKNGVVQTDATLPPRGRVPRKRRATRRERALAMIGRRGRNTATALDIGIAMTSGKTTYARTSKAEKETMGLAMATRLLREGIVVATRDNRFILTKLANEAMALK
jgi:hypothetical protein